MYAYSQGEYCAPTLSMKVDTDSNKSQPSLLFLMAAKERKVLEGADNGFHPHALGKKFNIEGVRVHFGL